MYAFAAFYTKRREQKLWIFHVCGECGYTKTRVETNAFAFMPFLPLHKGMSRK